MQYFQPFPFFRPHKFDQISMELGQRMKFKKLLVFFSSNFPQHYDSAASSQTEEIIHATPMVWQQQGKTALW